MTAPATSEADDGALTGEEVLERLGSKAALSHEEAASRLGIELVAAEAVPCVTLPRNRSRVVVAGWNVRRADLSDEDVTTVDGARVTSASRTVVDLCRTLPLTRAVVAADSALRQKMCAATDLATLLNSAMGQRAGRLRAVGALMDPLSGSVLESLLRVLICTAGLPLPTSQREIRDEYGRVVARVDLCWVGARLVVEADGFAFHADRVSFRQDRDRMNELERLGWRVLRFTWEDVMSRPHQVLALIEECLALAGAA